MKSKTIACLLIVHLCLFTFCVGNQGPATAPSTTQQNVPAPTTTQAASDIPLNNLQIEACTSADQGGTCQTKLKDFGMVALEDCCKYLNKCC